MKKKYLVVVILIVLFQIFVPSFLYVKADDGVSKQPEVCSWPSEMMTNYFNFQAEAISILLWSEINERLLNVSFGSWGLFTNKVLDLSAIDLIASSLLWRVKSSASNLLTSAVLVALVSASVVQSNVEWRAILYKDRPVVRDYKKMLDIETQLFDVAYHRSKQINLTRPLEWDMATQLRELIKKYQEIWLLDKGKELENDSSMSDVILGLLSMNAAMKHFIMVGGKLWKSGLSAYNWCIWFFGKNCNKDSAVLSFKQSSIDQLYEDYRGVMAFSACNSFANYFVNSVDKTISNGKETVSSSIQDVKKSMNNLWWSLVGKGRRDFRNNRSNMCDEISDYEMAQLRAYWWPDRTCWKWIKASLDTDFSSAWLNVEKYSNEKSAQKEEKRRDDNQGKWQNVWASEVIWSKSTTSEKKLLWYKIYWSGREYNIDFSSELNSNFDGVFEEIMAQYLQSQRNAISSDIPDLMYKWRWILDQIDTTVKNAEDLKDILQKIVKKQCSS